MYPVYPRKIGASMCHSMGYVVVTLDGPVDGGDFGPYTSGTRTSGIQEAFDYAAKNGLNVFIAGTQTSSDAMKAAVYSTTEPITIPAMQGFRIDGGFYVISYTGTTGDAVVIDSAMNCYYSLGLVVSKSEAGAGIRVRPKSPVPIDGVQICTALEIRVEGIVGAGTFDVNTWQLTNEPGGSGLVLDSTYAPIVWSRFDISEVLLCNRNVHLTGPTGKSIAFNEITVTHNHQAYTHLQMGDETVSSCQSIYSNRLTTSMNSDGIRDAIGAVVSGSRNRLTIMSSSGMAPGKDLIFAVDARENVVEASALQSGYTNNAETPTNRLVSLWNVGFGISTPAVPKPDQYLVNREPYTVEITILDPGDVIEWSICDANSLERTVKAPLTAGERFLLAPGDKVRFAYTEAPDWLWRVVG